MNVDLKAAETRTMEERPHHHHYLNNNKHREALSDHLQPSHQLKVPGVLLQLNLRWNHLKLRPDLKSLKLQIRQVTFQKCIAVLVWMWQTT